MHRQGREGANASHTTAVPHQNLGFDKALLQCATSQPTPSHLAHPHCPYTVRGDLFSRVCSHLDLCLASKSSGLAENGFLSQLTSGD